MSRTIEIENAAKAQLWEAYNFIRKKSLQNAEKVRARILESIKILSSSPERHPPDKYCLQMMGTSELMKCTSTGSPIMSQMKKFIS